ncbi:MAG: RNA polymerase sigma factor [Emticicia sp.]|uniref:RNA polymerase sigma factor n=1 Tax=Emticicia sp. TaxID=1930953 RepID=UPI003BA7244B
MNFAEKEFINLIETNQGIIHKVCAMYCQDNNDKKDLYQEIILQLWKALPTFSGNAKVSSWMYQIALNTAITQLRKSYKKPKFEAVSEPILNISADDYDESYEAKSAFLYAAIKQLSEIEKAVIMLYLEEYPNEQIAEIMGITQNNVRVKLHRIQEKIKDILTTKNYERA